MQQADDGEGDDLRELTDLVEQPAKVMRIGSMIRQLLEEVKSAPLDDASRNRLEEIHRSSIKELESGLAPELVEELERLSLPFTEDATPSDAELRIAQAQLVGWLEGLFHGIQTAIYAQQVSARAQFEQMRRALPAVAQGQPGGAGRVPQEPGSVPAGRDVPLRPRLAPRPLSTDRNGPTRIGTGRTPTVRARPTTSRPSRLMISSAATRSQQAGERGRVGVGGTEVNSAVAGGTGSGWPPLPSSALRPGGSASASPRPWTASPSAAAPLSWTKKM